MKCNSWNFPAFVVIITAKGTREMDYRKTAAERIKYYRKLCRLSQEELGDVVDISCKHISTLENGEATMGIDTLMKICQAFGVTPNDILLEPDA